MEGLFKSVLKALVETLEEDSKKKCDHEQEEEIEEEIEEIKEDIEFKTIKNIFKKGIYKSKAYNYYNNKKGSGIVKIIHNNNTIDLEHVLKLHPEIDCDKKPSEPNHQLKRTGTITLDNYNKIYYDQKTQCATYMEGISSQAKYAVKHMELDIISEFEAVFIGYGSSHSSKTYHASPDIKKIIKKDENSDSFSVKTYLDGKLAYECSYEKQ